jgi:uncharacterized protein CbrC (UPF0167 family)
MPLYTFSYDLNSPGQKYDKLIAEIERTPGYISYLKSQWFLATEETSTQLSNRLKRHLDDSDRYLIDLVTKELAGFLDSDVIDWIKKYERLVVA